MHAPAPKLPALPSPQRSRSRRERRCEAAARRPVLHVVAPGMEVGRAEIKPRETISAFLRRTGWAFKDKVYGWQFRKGLPTVLEVNGEGILRKRWRYTRISANDNVRFVSYPLGGQGGGSKQIIGLVALIAVSAFALWAGPLVATALGFAGSTIVGGLATAAIGLGGSLLINSLTSPKQGATNAPTATQDQIYSVAAAGNTAKLGQPLPIWYGRLKVFPDFAATPWGEFVGNDQFLNVLLSPTMGSLSYEALYIDDTILWDSINGVSATFPGAQVAFYEPGATVSLFPVNVDSSIEVSGQQLPDGTGTLGGQYTSAGITTPGAWLGPFVANPSGTQTQAIAIDFVMPGGCFTVNSTNNNIGFAVLGIEAQAAPCDDAGAQTGPFSDLFNVNRNYASTSPIRDSIKTSVTPGRYLVRFRRLDAGLTSTLGSNSVVWASLRSFLVGANSFPDVSTVAIRLLASQSTQGTYKFGVLATRKLPVWNGSTFVTQATRSPGWAFHDAVTNAQYGSGLPIAKEDFNAVVSFDAGCTSRSDTFDYIFTTAVAIPAALDKMLTPGRAKHFWLGDTVSIVRDEYRNVPNMMLTDREIVRDSTQVTWTMLGDEDPDAVIVEYVDENTWRPAQVQYPPDDVLFTATHAEVKRIDGIVDRDQAFRECAFYYLQSIYRRENVQIGTEYEGRAITFGSVLRVQSELPMAYGYGGAVVDVVGNSLVLNPAPVWDTAPFYIRLRMPNGKWFGPVVATMGADASIANLDPTSLAAVQTSQSTTLAAVLLRESGGEDPSFELGTGVSQSKLCVVLNGVPNGELCTLNLVVDDIRVHATDLGSPPILPTSQFPSNADVPLLIGLNASFGQGTAEPMLSASWFPSPGALYYIADVSYDSGVSWAQVYQGQDNKFSAVVTLAALRLRVQAVSIKVRGPYATVDLAAPTIVISSETVELTSLNAGIRDQVTKVFTSLQDQINKVNSTFDTIKNEIARNWNDKKEVRNQITAQFGIAYADITSVQTVATNTQAAFAALTTTVTATFGSLTAQITSNSSAIATLNGYAAASYSVTLSVDGYASGFSLINGGTGFTSFTVLSDKFQVALPGFAGGAPIPVFTIAAVGGVNKIALRGDMIVDGSLTTRTIQAGAITTVTLGASSITASKIAANTITADRIATGAITSASGAIGALSVQSLSIADQAVIIPIVQVLSAPASNTTVSSISLSINTNGLAGKAITVLAQFNAQTGVGPNTGSVSGNLFINGTLTASSIMSCDAADVSGMLTIVGVYSFTASGGVDVIPVRVDITGQPVTTRVLFGQVMKR